MNKNEYVGGNICVYFLCKEQQETNKKMPCYSKLKSVVDQL